jgi:GAF domain-containing protein
MTDPVDTRIQPQEAFEQLARIALADSSMDTVMDKVAELTQRTVPGAHEVSVTLVEKGVARTVSFTGPLSLALDERQYAHGWGPCLDSLDGAEPVLIDSMSTETRWPGWVVEARQHGAGSSLSMPVPLQREVAAALNIYSDREHAFDQSSVELATTFAGYAGVALTNMYHYEAQGVLAEQLQTAMHSRAVIEQAKGIVMGQRRCTAREAFDILTELSQSSNRKLRDVAQVVVDDVGTVPVPA